MKSQMWYQQAHTDVNIEVVHYWISFPMQQAPDYSKSIIELNTTLTVQFRTTGKCVYKKDQAFCQHVPQQGKHNEWWMCQSKHCLIKTNTSTIFVKQKSRKWEVFVFVFDRMKQLVRLKNSFKTYLQCSQLYRNYFS